MRVVGIPEQVEAELTQLRAENARLLKLLGLMGVASAQVRLVCG